MGILLTSRRQDIAKRKVDGWVLWGEEMQSLHKNQTWKLVELPKGNGAIGCKWVYKKKKVVSEKEDEKFKARLVAKGYSQKYGVDYDEIFSLMVKQTSIKIVLS